jgi:hypothetical protein
MDLTYGNKETLPPGKEYNILKDDVALSLFPKYENPMEYISLATTGLPVINALYNKARERGIIAPNHELFWDVVQNYVLTYRIPEKPEPGYDDGRTISFTNYYLEPRNAGKVELGDELVPAGDYRKYLLKLQKVEDLLKHMIEQDSRVGGSTNALNASLENLKDVSENIVELGRSGR